jgi:circadian clock protein KaiC
VIKMRGSEHSHEFRTYDVTAKGVVVGASLTEYDCIITGNPMLRVTRSAVQAKSAAPRRGK